MLLLHIFALKETACILVAKKIHIFNRSLVILMSQWKIVLDFCFQSFLLFLLNSGTRSKSCMLVCTSTFRYCHFCSNFVSTPAFGASKTLCRFCLLRVPEFSYISIGGLYGNSNTLCFCTHNMIYICSQLFFCKREIP